MTKIGWLNATKGRKGGIVLSRDPRTFRLGEIVQTLEESKESSAHLIDCSNHHFCPFTSSCVLPGILNEALQTFYHTLNQYTLYDLLSKPSVQQQFISIQHRMLTSEPNHDSADSQSH